MFTVNETFMSETETRPRRDRDVWLYIRDETETETRRPYKIYEARPRHFKNRSRDHLETETSRPRLHPCEPVLPRQRRPPSRLDGGAEPHQDQDCKEFYRRIYYSTIDTALSCLKNRLQSPAFTNKAARNIEAAVVQALSTDTSPSLDAIVQHFGQDLDEKRLRLHLSMFRDLCV